MPNRPPHIMDTPPQDDDDGEYPPGACPLSHAPDAILRRLERKIDALDLLIRGPSNEPERGIPYRLAQVERSVAGYSRVVWAVVIALVGVIVHAIFRKT